jgi:fibronectin type 3 domain-containing protein
MRPGRAAWAAVWLAAAGCGAALDVESAARLLRSAETPRPPLLREEPPAELPAPEGLRAVAGELRAVPLKWDPVLVGEVGGYVVERSIREKGDFQRIGLVTDRFETSFVDRGDDLAPKALPDHPADLGDGATYHYRVRPFDAAGRIGVAASEVVDATTAAAPARAEDLRVYSYQPRKIALTWRPVGDPTVAGYRIYRSPSEGGEYLPVAEVAGRYTTTWVDRELAPLRVFYYRVAAVNQAGGEGVSTSAARGVTKPEPLPPAALRVEQRALGRVRLSWDPNVEPNIAGYRLLRTREGSREEELVAELGRRETSAEDRAVAAGERVVYRAVAFDRDGLVSAPSDPVEVTAAGYGLEARAEGGAVRLRWTDAGDFDGARVLREGRFGAREIARVRGSEYLDRAVEPGGTYRYSVVLTREDGREAPPSESVEVVVPPAGAAVGASGPTP